MHGECKMDDTVHSLKDQLKELQLSKVTSTDKIIGKGAYGRVIEVYVHGTLCAAKEIHPLLVEQASPREFEAIRKSFSEECIRNSRIHHPNVVQMIGIYYPSPQAKLPWLVMELMDTSLKGFLEKHGQGKVPLHFKLSILADVAQGLEFIHGQDIIHRDLSSNNVLLTRHMVAKIADLGVAKVIEHNKMKTHTTAPGTTHFMPPETLCNRPRYGKPVDVFSLACVALHVMSHQWPEPKDLLPEGSLTALTEVQRRDEYITFCTYPALKELVELCLHNKPEQRLEISAVRVKLKELKVAIEKQIPFAADNNYKLFDVVRQVNIQYQKLSTTNKKLTNTVAQLEATIQRQGKENDQQIQEKNRQIQERDQQIQKKDQQIRERDQQIQEKDKQIRERDQQIQEKDQQRDQQIRERDQQIQEKDQQRDQQIRERDQQIQEKDKQIQERDQQIQKRDQQIQERDQQIQKRDHQIQERDQQIQKRDQQIQERDQQIQKRDQQTREKDHQIQERDQQIRERDQQTREKDHQIRERDQQIQKRDQQTREKDHQIQERDQQIRERDQQIQERDKKIEELQILNRFTISEKMVCNPLTIATEILYEHAIPNTF